MLQIEKIVEKTIKANMENNVPNKWLEQIFGKTITAEISFNSKCSTLDTFRGCVADRSHAVTIEEYTSYIK